MDNNNDHNRWEIDRLKERTDKHGRRLDSHDGRIFDLERFQESTMPKLITLFKTIDEMKEDDKFFKRLFANSLIGGAIAACFSLGVWAFQRLF